MSTSPTEPSGPSGLGSLSQAARGKHLRQARRILVIVGLLTLVFNGAFFVFAPAIVHGMVEREVKKNAPGQVVDRAKVQEFEDTLVRENRLAWGGTAILGIVFIVLGAMVYQFSVQCEVRGLGVYVGSGVTALAMHS